MVIIEHKSIEESFYEESYNSTPFFQGMSSEKYRGYLDEKRDFLKKNKLPLLAISNDNELLGYIFISSNKIAELHLKNHSSELMDKLKTSNLEHTLKEKRDLINMMYLTTAYGEFIDLNGFTTINLNMEKIISDDTKSYGIEFREFSSCDKEKYFNLELFKKNIIKDYMQENPFLSENDAKELFETSVTPVFKMDNQKMYGIHYEDKVIGLLWLLEKTPDVTFIAYVEIFEDFRGQGFGKKVMYDMFSFVHKLGYKSLQLHVFGHNTKAVKLYEQTGFKNTIVRYRYLT